MTQLGDTITIDLSVVPVRRHRNRPYVGYVDFKSRRLKSLGEGRWEDVGPADGSEPIAVEKIQ